MNAGNASLVRRADTGRQRPRQHRLIRRRNELLKPVQSGLPQNSGKAAGFILIQFASLYFRFRPESGQI